MAISVAQARQICTKAELELVLKSTTRQIGNFDAKQLRASIRRARTLRDKWRDLAHAQTRDTKAEDPGNLDRANARSAEKAQLFDEALGRFEKRLSKVEASSNGSAGTAKSMPKKVRASEHRAKRSEVRSTLNEKTGKLNATPASQKATAKPATRSTATGKSTEPASKSTKRPADRKLASKKGATKKAAPKRKAAPRASARSASAATNPPTHGLAAAAMAAGRDGAEGGGDKPTGAEKKRNLKAKTAAKATAVSRSGAPRIQGHVSSQGRRNQAKRSSR